jgi:diguanylate cyclase (GGDEF)-like protein
MPQPQTRSELVAWVRRSLQLAPEHEASLLQAVDSVLGRHERLWQESKQEAIHALSAGFARKMSQVREELSARDATVSSISRYFERLVADLTDRSHRDPRTRLMNFAHFTEQVESFLALDQRGRWCAIGLVDIAHFKWYNDALGHAVGDRLIERVATILREQVRSDDLLAQERGAAEAPNELHARLGGDEFCFLMQDIPDYHLAYAIGERFREAVEGFDWSLEDPRLADRPVRVDVGIVCLWLGQVADRRPIARTLAAALIQRADMLMYEAKGEAAGHVHLAQARIVNGGLVEASDDEVNAHPTLSRE